MEEESGRRHSRDVGQGTVSASSKVTGGSVEIAGQAAGEEEGEGGASCVGEGEK